MKQILVDIGIPANAVVTESESRNTAENAAHSARVLKALGVSSILLVTSAYHVSRATDRFRREGLSVTPVPSSRESRNSGFSLGSLIPSSLALFATTGAIKEYVGRWVGR